MALGIKSIETLEKGDVIVADGYMDVYDYDSDIDKYIPYDTAFKGDELGYYYKEFSQSGGKSVIAFLPLDAVKIDGSPDYKNRIYYFVLKSESYSFKANPKYDYPASIITQIDEIIPQNEDNSPNWFQRNKRNIIIGFGLSLLAGMTVYITKQQRKWHLVQKQK